MIQINVVLLTKSWLLIDWLINVDVLKHCLHCVTFYAIVEIILPHLKTVNNMNMNQWESIVLPLCYYDVEANAVLAYLLLYKQNKQHTDADLDHWGMVWKSTLIPINPHLALI